MNNLTIVTVNYYTSDYIGRLISSIRHNDPGFNFHFSVVNNSPEEDITPFSAEKDKQYILPMPYNAGFARANNAGIRASHSEVVLLLNPDTLVEDDAISRCCERFVQSGHVACGVQLLNEDRSPQISGSHFITGGINHFLPLPFVGTVVQKLGYLMKVKKTSVKEASGEIVVDWINGAFLMVKRSAIEKAGMLDEDFFLYAEEIEWCSRLRKVGTLCVYGDLHVIHLEGQSSNESFGSSGKGYYNLYDDKGKQIMVSNFLRIRKQFGASWFLIHLLVYLFTVPIFLAGLFIQKLFFVRGYSWKQLAGYCKNVAYVLGLSGKMIANKPHFYKAI